MEFHLHWAGFEVGGDDPSVVRYWYSLLKELERANFRLFHVYIDPNKPQLFLHQNILNASSSYTLSWVNTQWKPWEVLEGFCKILQARKKKLLGSATLDSWTLYKSKKLQYQLIFLLPWPVMTSAVQGSRVTAPRGWLSVLPHSSSVVGCRSAPVWLTHHCGGIWTWLTAKSLLLIIRTFSENTEKKSWNAKLQS